MTIQLTTVNPDVALLGKVFRDEAARLAAQPHEPPSYEDACNKARALRQVIKDAGFDNVVLFEDIDALRAVIKFTPPGGSMDRDHAAIALKSGQGFQPPGVPRVELTFSTWSGTTPRTRTAIAWDDAEHLSKAILQWSETLDPRINDRVKQIHYTVLKPV